MTFDDGNSKKVRLSYKKVRFEDGNVREVRFGDSERWGSSAGPRVGSVAARAIAQNCEYKQGRRMLLNGPMIATRCVWQLHSK